MSMADYRDYGNLVGEGVSPLSPVVKNKGQVYQATHKGEQYLPFMNRSFISFSFGGRNIEDFNLLSVIVSNRMSKAGYSSFKDIVTDYDILDGQLYWGTHFNANALDFNLATDGMSQQELDEFLLWFSPGQIRELILSEHPNRAIKARVSQPPQLSLLPFEEKITTMIGGYPYNTSTTKYKGEITLSFVMDEPFWYSKINIFGYADSRGIYHDTWTDANGETKSVYDDPDAIKIALEDGIPISSMLSVSLLLGDNTFANMDSDQNGIIAMCAANITLVRDINDDHLTLSSYDIEQDIDEGSAELYNTTGNNINETFKWRAIAFSTGTSYAIDKNDDADTIYTKLLAYSMTASPDDPYTITKNNVTDVNWRSRVAELSQNADEYVRGAKVAGPIMDSTSGIPLLENNSKGYFYYAGTAPSYPILRFTLTPTMSNNYINSPKNSYTTLDTPYNIITIESLNKYEFKFTTPNLYTSYNQAINIFDTMSSGTAWEALREQIRANVNHFEVRKWAMRVIDSLDTGSGIIVSSSSEAKYRMSCMFRDLTDINKFLEGSYMFDSKTGKAIGDIRCRQYTGSTPSNNREWWQLTAGNITTLHEDVGDMVRSSYLVIRDRNYPDKNGHILAREDNNPETYQYSHVLYHDVPNGLQNVFIEYQNMYL